MDKFYHERYRKAIKSWFFRIDETAGTHLQQRYDEWLKIMDAAIGKRNKSNGIKRVIIPAGLPSCTEYLVKKNDFEKWLATEELYAPRPDYRLYRKPDALAEYNFGLSYYFMKKSEIKSRLRQINEILNTPPEDRFAPTKDPYAGIHIPFSPETQTARMLIDAMLNENAKRIRHKIAVYDEIIAMVAIKTLGLDAKPVLEKALFEKYVFDSDPELDKMVEYALKNLEKEWCDKREILWTDKKVNPDGY